MNDSSITIKLHRPITSALIITCDAVSSAFAGISVVALSTIELATFEEEAEPIAIAPETCVVVDVIWLVKFIFASLAPVDLVD